MDMDIEMTDSDGVVDSISQRFRGFLPVVVDVETAGFDPEKNALLEVAAIPIIMNEDAECIPGELVACHVEPFKDSILDQKSLEFNGIDPFHPFRIAKPEAEALKHVFKLIQHYLGRENCSRAILVGHNPAFDLGFIKAATERCKLKKNPFHSFSTFDTASLAGLAYGQTVLARAIAVANIEWDHSKAHSAVYDTEKTAELFCKIVNTWDQKIGI